MTAAGQAARIAAPRARVRRKTVERRGAVWIAVIAALLAGVVALNVAVLRLNVQMDDLDQERARLRAEKAELVSLLAGELASTRIELRARDELGLVDVDPTQTRYVELRP
jgi:cell division protein FtsB